MATDATGIDHDIAERLLTTAVATGDYATLHGIVANLGGEKRPVVPLSGQEPNAVDRFLAFCADHQLLSNREIIDFSVRMMRLGHGIRRTNICTAGKQAVQTRFLTSFPA